jgi:ABC-type molybdate transport system substrate-binding protein
MRAAALALTVAVMTVPAHADIVSLYAAGSLRGALTDIAKAYEATSANKVQARFGPSGTLKDEIAGGAKAGVFASANMEHPRALHDAGKSGPVVLFARNKLCALASAQLKVSSGNLLDRMLDAEVRLGISTPKADPSGDYALEVLRKADAIRPGAQAILAKKAKQLTGGPDSAAPPAGRNVYGWHVAEQHADIFLTYCTNAVIAARENPGQQIIPLPDKLAVGANYGLTVVKGAAPAAEAFADFIVSPQGEAILAGYGFSPATSP